ncbi:serine hydrolase [Anatilimnocola floriformis]|uniref:serine hydrolase n=1 Tax=Anatilimnocola floriformis TaxID=2948575 RepID=UPI0020C4563B|nr:serine hydrolase [Anatilimnocola floriformis]
MLRSPVLLVALFVLVSTAFAAAAERYDVVIQGGRIVDGSGAVWFSGDVAIRDGKIAKIGRVDAANAARVIDAKGLIVAPGFIDMMGQTATPLLRNPATAANLLSQGITTINCGEGVSQAPQSAADAKSLGWQTAAEYFQLLDMQGLPVNAVQTIGHTQARLLVLGEVDRRPSPDELKQMQQLVREGMEAGAIGVSTSLIYPPAVYASQEEIAALASVAGEFGGKYFTHMRNEGDKLLEAIDEALAIGEQAKMPVHIFHLKAAGQQNWPKMAQAIDKIKAARARGQQVTADVYPYINNGLGIAALIHPRHFAAGEPAFRAKVADAELRKTIRKEMEESRDYENWYRHIGSDWNRLIIGQTNDERFNGTTGKSLAEIAKDRKEDPWDTFFELVKAGAFVLPESMQEANIQLAMQHPFVSFCTDVGPAGGSRIASHPRAFGAFPRVIARFIREQQTISLERAISQASAAAANNILAFDRGRITEGAAADVIVFDYDKFTDKATFAQPHAQAEGMKYVLVNGELVWDDGVQTKRRPGRVLRGPGYKGPPSATTSAAKSVTKIKSLDQLFPAFLDKHSVPGCSVAVMREGKLVYARGFGFADVATREAVSPESLFRIASISKPFTAVAILQLIEQGKLKLDDPVHKFIDDEPLLVGDAKLDERQAEITIRQLLEHRGGWDRDKSFDGMFQSLRFAKALGKPSPPDVHDIIRNMRGLPLDFPPGERYAYSNYGYCLLGRVIEKITQRPYEEYVKDQVLKPLQITSMRIGGSHLEDRFPGEVRYYDPALSGSVFQNEIGQQRAAPYGAYKLEVLDSHGGWIASAVDLVRFAAAFDEPEKCPLLKAGSIVSMFSPPPIKYGETYYALGWQVRPLRNKQRNAWHTGSLPGTSTILIRRHDGLNIAVLFNSRVSPTAQHLTRELEGPLHAALDEVRDWPIAQ